MMKQLFKNSTIEIWHKDYINKESWVIIDEKDKNAEIIQIEYAYDYWFIVEVRRPCEIKVESKNYADVIKEDKSICTFCNKYNGDGIDDTDGHDYYSCRLMNEDDMNKHGQYSSLDNQVFPEDCKEYMCETCRYIAERGVE